MAASWRISGRQPSCADEDVGERTGAPLLSASSHAVESFDIIANEYAAVVAEVDARTLAVEELRRDIVTQLTLFLQRRAAETPTLRKP